MIDSFEALFKIFQKPGRSSLKKGLDLILVLHTYE